MKKKPWPVLMQPQDIIYLAHAVERTKKTDRTIRRWCHEYGIGRQSGANSPWEISAPALEMVVYGDMEALELLRSGERNCLQVRRYFDHLGIAA